MAHLHCSPGASLIALAALVVGLGALGACAGPAAPPRAEGPREGTAVHDGALQEELARVSADFRGAVGIYARHLRDGRYAGLRADEAFPAASMVKVPILLGLFLALERGPLRYRERLRYDASRAYPGEDLLARLQDGAWVTVAELCTLMCAFSDNTASLWCQELAGTGTAINAALDARGFVVTRVNSRTEGRGRDYEAHGWGQTTPREMAELLVAIRERRAVSPAADVEMERALSRSVWTGEGLSRIPPTVHAISKQGAVSASRSEVLLVDGPHGAFVLCVITKDQEDRSWEPDNEGFELIRAVTAAVWRHFEPPSASAEPWSPPPGSAAYH